MARPDKHPAVAPEALKALLDAQSWECQARFFQLCLIDRESAIGHRILSILACLHERVRRLEELAGIGEGDIDPQQLLGGTESLKEAKGRLARPTTGAVKQLRHRQKQKVARQRAALKYSMPAVEAAAGRVTKVTELP
jgi:hypothetical protein